MANVRARARREVEETRQYAVQKFAANVVEAAENLRRGIDSLPRPEPDRRAGDRRPCVATAWKAPSGRFPRPAGTQPASHAKTRSTGQPFDPNLHQAMAEPGRRVAHAPGTVMQAWTPA